MKRLLSLALALTMLLTCGLVPMAGAASKDELTEVTLKVKEQLKISDDYTNFTNNSSDFGVIRYYELSWSDDEGGYVNVTADNTGKVLWYSASSSTPSTNYNENYAPSFPKVTEAQLTSIAKEFLGRVIAKPESVELEPVDLRAYGPERYASVSGTIYINGVATAVGCSVRIRLDNQEVISFNRDDSWSGVYENDVPSATPAVKEADATAKLRDALKMELCYVNKEKDTIGLRYMPADSHSRYVDAQTGELVDLTEVYENVSRTSNTYATGAAAQDAGAPVSEAESSSKKESLTEVEQSAVEKLANVLSAEELDALVRKYADLKLDGFTQTLVNYSMDNEQDNKVFCQLTYSRYLTKDEVTSDLDEESFDEIKPKLMKYVTVDASDGKLISVSTSAPYVKQSNKVDEANNKKVVEKFLTAAYPEYFASSKNMEEDGTRYIRVVNGCPYYSNYLNATVLSLDNSIAYFNMNWDDEAKFPSTEKVVGEKAAMDAYLANFKTTLFYTSYPVEVDTSKPDWRIYSNSMGTAYRWVLSYILKGDDIQGVDALTGKIEQYDRYGEALTYTDCDSSYAKEQIEALANYGIGFGKADTFQPTAKLTQRDMLVLLLNATGWGYDVDDMDAETEKELYNNAYYANLLTKEQKDPTHVVTRMEFIKALIGASSYGKAAKITGIYHTSFADADSIPAADLGYVAIAEGLGLVNGDENHNFAPNYAVTRQDAALMLYQFMSI